MDWKRLSGAICAAMAMCACTTPQLPTSPSNDDPEPARVEFRSVNLVDKDATPLQGADVATAAWEYVQQRKALLGLGVRDDLVVRATSVGAGGLEHVRMTHQIDGVPVWGGDIVVHISDGTFKSVVGHVASGLRDFDVTPTLDPAQAAAIAKAHYSAGGKVSGATMQFSRESTTLRVYAPRGSQFALVWHVQFFTELQNGINPGLWNYFVDARTGEILGMFNGIHTLSQASGPGGNAKVSRQWVNELDVEPSGGMYKMDTARLRTTNMNNSTSGNGTIVTGPLDNIGDAPINDAHGFAEATVNMMNDWMGHNSIDDNGYIIRSRVHYGNNYENAFWDGSQMTYGDGANTFYPLSGDVDVVAHEINHGFTSFHSNLTYSGQSGGINESFSDVAGTVTEFYVEGNSADWDLGTDIFKSNGALRYMCNPPADGISIDNAADYYSGLDVHYSSGVFNKAFCLASKRIASGSPTGNATATSVHRAGQAWYEANANYWTASTSFTQGCQGVIDAANAMGFSASEITYLQDSFADVGVYCGSSTPPPPTCDQTFTAASGTFTSPNYPNNYPNNYSKTWCIDTGSMATLTFNDFNTEAGYDFVTIRDANAAVVSTTAGTTAPADVTSMKIYVTFASDQSVTRPGFQASWSSGGGGNNAPTVSITAPMDGSTVSGMVSVTASASDSDGSVAKVTFTLPDGSTVDDVTAPYSTSWDSSTVPNGTGYTISAVATDDMGATSSTDSVMVDVDNGGGGGNCIDGTFTATDTPINIPDNNSQGITSTIDVSGPGDVGTLQVSVDITHTWRGDLIVRLVSPSGTTHTLANRSGGSADDLHINTTVSTFNGETAAGTWQLRVSDRARYDIGTLDAWSLTIVGDCGGGGGGGAWSASSNPNLPTADNTTVCDTVTVADDGNAADVLLDISGQHDWRSILRGTLEHNGVTQEAFPTGTFPSNAGAFGFTDRAISGFSGSAAGDWTFCLTDTDGYGDSGVLESWSVHN